MPFKEFPKFRVPNFHISPVTITQQNTTNNPSRMDGRKGKIKKEILTWKTVVT